MLGIPTIFQAATSADTEKIEIEQLLGALDISDDFDIDTTDQSRVFNVKDYLPTWLVDEHDNGNTLFVKFMQYYYDWLYNPEISNIYNNRVFDFIDIEKIIDPMVTTALNSHVPGLADIFANHNYTPKVANVRKFLKNIKRDIYQRKGTPSSASILFGTLFSEVSSVNVPVTEGPSYSTNLATIAPRIMTGRACITVFGDSINNAGTETGNMRHGFIREWTPDYWRGICIVVSPGNRRDNRWTIQDFASTNSDGSPNSACSNPVREPPRCVGSGCVDPPDDGTIGGVRDNEINGTPDHSTSPPISDGIYEGLRNDIDPDLDGVASAPNSLVQLTVNNDIALPILGGGNPQDSHVNGSRFFSIGKADTFPPSTDTNGDGVPNEGDDDFAQSWPVPTNGFFVGNEQNQSSSGDEDTAPFYHSSDFKLKSLIYAVDDQQIGYMYRQIQQGNSGQTVNQRVLLAGWNTDVLDIGHSGIPVDTADGGIQGSLSGKISVYYEGQFEGAAQGLNRPRLQVKSLYLCDETIDGLALDYLGAGGWQSGNHAADNDKWNNGDANNGVPFLNIAGVNGLDNGPRSGRGWYSDESMQQSFNLIGTNIAMIWIGQNDGAMFRHRIEDMIHRIRKNAVAAIPEVVYLNDDSGPITNFQIIIITPYETQNEPAGGEAGFFAQMEALHKSLAEQNSDVSHINLYRKIRDDLGDFAAWGNEQNEAGDSLSIHLKDGVHPTRFGAREFARMIWDIISDAATPGAVDDGVVINTTEPILNDDDDPSNVGQALCEDIFREFIEPAGFKIRVRVEESTSSSQSVHDDDKDLAEYNLS